MSDPTGTEKIGGHACLLLSTHWADACSQPSIWPHILVNAREIAIGCSSTENGSKEGGVGLSVWCTYNQSHTTLHWCMKPQSWVCCHKLWGPPVQRLHPAALFQMCLTASLGHRQHCLSWRYRGLVDLQCGSLTPLLKCDSIRGKIHNRSLGWLFMFSSCLRRMSSFVTEFILTCIICFFFVSSALICFIHTPLYFNIAFDLCTAALSPITMSSCAVIYSPINIPPLVLVVGSGLVLIMLKLQKLNSCQHWAH